MEGKKVVGPSSGTSSGPSSRCISGQRFFATGYRSYLSYAIASLGICTGLRRMLVAAHPHSTPPRAHISSTKTNDVLGFPFGSWTAVWVSLSRQGCANRITDIYGCSIYTQLEAERELGLPCWDRGGARRNRRPLSVREGLHRTVYVSIHLYVKPKARQPATRASGAHRLCLHCPCLHSSMYSVYVPGPAISPGGEAIVARGGFVSMRACVCTHHLSTCDWYACTACTHHLYVYD